MASKAAKADPKLCPGCKSVVGKKRYNLRDRPSVLSAQTSEFCRQCLDKPAASASRTDCGDDRFTNESLKTLRTCPDISLDAVKGVSRCPSIRACPTCGILLQHDNKNCKKVVCPRCGGGFCFVCLKSTETCLKTSSAYSQCSSGLAARQTSVPVWQKK